MTALSLSPLHYKVGDSLVSRPTINEREIATALVGVLNGHIQRDSLPFEQISADLKGSDEFPDIVVWTDYGEKRVFALCKLKSPNSQAEENPETVLEKAAVLGARYVVLWDFQYGELCKVLDHQLDRLKEYPALLLRSLEEWGDPFRRAQVEEQAKRILDDLARLARGESLPPYVPDKFYFIGILQEAVQGLVPLLERRIFQEKKKREVQKRLNWWAVQQGYPTALPNLDDLMARHWAYSLVLRILFYFIARRYDPSLPDLSFHPGNVRSFSDLLWNALSYAQGMNWPAFFERFPLDGLGLPPAAENVLNDFLEKFHRYDFGLLNEDVVGQILENIVPPEDRHNLGQFFTREDLVDLILGFIADRHDATYLDPTCGSGAFLNRLCSRLRWLAARHSQETGHALLLERLWGIDIAHFPAELATINLFRQIRDTRNFPRIIVQDFFQIRPGQVLDFPSTQTSAREDVRNRLSIPPFHGIVGNFPYIRQELIERQNPGYKREIVRAIAREWFWKDPDLFYVEGIQKRELETVLREGPGKYQDWLDKQIQNGRVDLRLSGQADIYAYLFYHAAAFLEEGGRMGIVTSNAWLDANYGYELKRFFLRHFKIIAIVASWAEPWFEDASVNTAFIILERCEDSQARCAHVVRFVKVKKSLTELLPQDLLHREADRWLKVDALVRQIETADAQVAHWDARTGVLEPPRGVHTLETDAFRVRLVPQAELEAELQAKGPTAKWGLYIRAPQVYFDILRAVGDKLVPLGQIAEIRNGCDISPRDFFCLEPLEKPTETPGALRVRNARGWVGEIEKDLLKPVLLSFKEVDSLAPRGLEARRYLFLCPYDREELQKRGYPKALEYIQWGEQQRTNGRGLTGSIGIPFPQISCAQSRHPEWFNLPVRSPGMMISNRFIGQRFGFPVNPGFITSSTFFEISPHDHPDLCAALLNSTFSFLLVELTGRSTWNQGVLYFYGAEIKDLLVPEIPRIPGPLQERISSAFDQLKQRPIMPIAQEVKQRDRRVLDEAVLEALGLDPKEYLPRIYEGLVELVRERLSFPKMTEGRKGPSRRIHWEQVVEKARQEMLPDGLKAISAFLPTHPRPEMQSIRVSGRPVSWHSFLTQHTLLDASGNEVGVLTGEESQACYALYAWVPGYCTLEIPADPVVAREAVRDYERYLYQIGNELIQRLQEATRNYPQAVQGARESLDSLGLPPIGIDKAIGD